MGSKRLTQQEFLKRFKEVHSDKYDYSKVVFNNVDEKVCIICKEHGEFWQTPYKHINRKQGCPYCSKNVKFTKENFINESLKTHIKKYDYSKVNYINAQEDVEIICPVHGSFWQKANLHRRGADCPMCVVGSKDTTETFIKKAKMIKGDLYDYSKVDYKGSKIKVEIGCPKHGYFFVKPNYHLNQILGGCPKCKESNVEKAIRFWLENCKDKLPLPFDFYIPYYKPYEFFGGEEGFTKTKNTIK